MADPFAQSPLALAGLSVDLLETVYCASLRYFAPTGIFAQAVHAGCGVALPGAGRAVSTPEQDMVLAWRSPTETVLLTAGAAELSTLAAALAAAPDGCLIELTGALKVLDLSGERIAQLLCRLGGSACVPGPGEARRGRLADVPVMALSLRAHEVQLLVERPYLPHLVNWMRETLLDFSAS
jgi:Sarcosine oxidase, gamma subunit family